jgi:hypothetical protein
MEYTFISEPEGFLCTPRKEMATVNLRKKEALSTLLHLIRGLNCKDVVVTCNNGTDEHPDIINIASVQTIAGKRYVIGPI